MKEFTLILLRLRDYAAGMGINVINSNKFNKFFKGDLDGTNIYIDFDSEDDEELFGLLHMLGHCLQWAASKQLRELGSTLHVNPDDSLLKELQEYEWEANCYGLAILHDLGINQLDEWLYRKYRDDMFHLTHFYKTGEKVKLYIPEGEFDFIHPLTPKQPPKIFTPSKIEGTRNGLVIDFKQ